MSHCNLCLKVAFESTTYNAEKKTEPKACSGLNRLLNLGFNVVVRLR